MRIQKSEMKRQQFRGIFGKFCKQFLYPNRLPLIIIYNMSGGINVEDSLALTTTKMGSHIIQSPLPVQNAKKKLFNGKDIGDIPSFFYVPFLEDHELAVVGTFVQSDIVPGFRYRVRKNGTKQYLFDGKALYLEAVGQGYGKRLTFQSSDILSNENFFWSDSNHELGYAFEINVLSPGNLLSIFIDEEQIGVARVLFVEDKQNILSSDNFKDDHFKDVQVNFTCTINDTYDENCRHINIEGTIRVVKRQTEKRFKVLFISAVLPTTGVAIQLRPL